MGSFGDFGGFVVAVFGCQSSDQHQRTVEAGGDIIDARFNADHAIVGEGDARVGHQPDGLQEVVGHHGVEHVQFEMA